MTFEYLIRELDSGVKSVGKEEGVTDREAMHNTIQYDLRFKNLLMNRYCIWPLHSISGSEGLVPWSWWSDVYEGQYWENGWRVRVISIHFCYKSWCVCVLGRGTWVFLSPHERMFNQCIFQLYCITSCMISHRGDNIAPHFVKNLNILFSKTQPYFITIVTCPLPRLYIGIICGSLINFVNFLLASFKKTEWFQCHNFTKFSFCFVFKCCRAQDWIRDEESIEEIPKLRVFRKENEASWCEYWCNKQQVKCKADSVSVMGHL